MCAEREKNAAVARSLAEKGQQELIQSESTGSRRRHRRRTAAEGADASSSSGGGGSAVTPSEPATPRSAKDAEIERARTRVLDDIGKPVRCALLC
jgi:hypothetical protein